MYDKQLYFVKKLTNNQQNVFWRYNALLFRHLSARKNRSARGSVRFLHHGAEICIIFGKNEANSGKNGADSVGEIVLCRRPPCAPHYPLRPPHRHSAADAPRRCRTGGCEMSKKNAPRGVRSNYICYLCDSMGGVAAAQQPEKAIFFNENISKQ